MKGEGLLKILDFIEDRGFEMGHLAAAILESGYRAPISRINYRYNQKQRKRMDTIRTREQKRQLQKYISKLKSNGFIEEDNKKEMVLSQKGKKKLEILKKYRVLDKNSFKKQVGDRIIIISYDLPVAFNRERDILREILRILGFNLVHKSVWVGKVKLPKQFILALEKLNILKFIEILEVTKQGTLRELQ